MPVGAGIAGRNAARVGSRGGGRAFFALLLMFVALCAISKPAHAQLARAFYNITGITAKQLPNAVQITIQTDGAVNVGGSQTELFDINELENRFATRTFDQFRIRFAGAKIKVPAFINLGVYPVDSCAVSFGNDPIERPLNFRANVFTPDVPRADVTIRFYIPITLQQFVFNSRGFGYTFADILSPRDVTVKVSPDGSAVIITVLTDRFEEARNAPKIRRVKPEEQKHSLQITPLDTQNGVMGFGVRALHAPLGDLVQQISDLTGTPLIIAPDTVNTDISLSLPRTNIAEMLRILDMGYGVSAIGRPDAAGGGWDLGRDGLPTSNELVKLNNLSPTAARLLFPDFLLKYLRPDLEQNALFINGTPALIAKVKADLAILDIPKPTITVTANVYEVTNFDNLAVSLSGNYKNNQFAFDTLTGTAAIRINGEQNYSITAALNALKDVGMAKLVDTAIVTTISGTPGTLFFGQTRYITVLQGSGNFGQQRIKALKLPIGTQLTVTPFAAGVGEVNLRLSPRFSTLDEVERGTGLPVVGIRTLNAEVRVRENDAALISTVESYVQDDRKRIGSIAQNRSRSGLVLIVTAKRTESGKG